MMTPTGRIAQYRAQLVAEAELARGDLDEIAGITYARLAPRASRYRHAAAPSAITEAMSPAR